MTPKEWTVYILECLDGSYYVGMTSRLPQRFDQHEVRLGGRYTAERGIRRLAHAERYLTREQALIREKQLKRWSRWKKEMLILGIWRQLDA